MVVPKKNFRLPKLSQEKVFDAINQSNGGLKAPIRRLAQSMIFKIQFSQDAQVESRNFQDFRTELMKDCRASKII